MSKTMLLLVRDETLRSEADTLAQRWGLQLTHDPVPGLQLELTTEHLQLIEVAEDAPGPVYVDFIGGAVGHRHRFGGGRGQSIAKAVGLKGGNNPSVVDATAGLGRDAFVLASLGCRVRMIERSEIVAALLEDGLWRATEDAEISQWISERMQLIHADAVEWMNTLPEEEFPEVVYLDPMFPHKQKSALVKKEMRLFQKLLGYDENEEALLNAALRIATKRVAVKRPDYAPPLADRKPTMVIKGKKQRYDVYVKAAM